MGLFSWIKKKKDDETAGNIEREAAVMAESVKAIKLTGSKMSLSSGEDITSEEMQDKVYDIIKEMLSRIGLDIPADQYPKVILTDRVGSSYNPHENVLVVNRKDVNSGDALGEEVSHFIRNFTQPKGGEREAVTSEFFGYLGRKILKESPKSAGLNFSPESETIPVRSDVLEINKKHKSNEKAYTDYATGAKVDPDKIISPKFASMRIRQERSARKDNVAHQRGYSKANKLDVSKVDLKTLYSLSNEQVRKSFF